MRLGEIEVLLLNKPVAPPSLSHIHVLRDIRSS